MRRFIKSLGLCLLLMMFVGMSDKLTVSAENINMSGMEDGINIGTAMNGREEGVSLLSVSDCTDIWLSGTYVYEDVWLVLELGIRNAPQQDCRH